MKNSTSLSDINYSQFISGRDWALFWPCTFCTGPHNTSGNDTDSSPQTSPFPPGSRARSTAGHSRWCPWPCCCTCGPVSPGNPFSDLQGRNRVTRPSRSNPVYQVVLCFGRQGSGSCHRCLPSLWRRRWSAPAGGPLPHGNEASFSSKCARCTSPTVRGICILSSCRASQPGRDSCGREDRFRVLGGGEERRGEGGQTWKKEKKRRLIRQKKGTKTHFNLYPEEKQKSFWQMTCSLKTLLLCLHYISHTKPLDHTRTHACASTQTHTDSEDKSRRYSEGI